MCILYKPLLPIVGNRRIYAKMPSFLFWGVIVSSHQVFRVEVFVFICLIRSKYQCHCCYLYLPDNHVDAIVIVCISRSICYCYCYCFSADHLLLFRSTDQCVDVVVSCPACLALLPPCCVVSCPSIVPMITLCPVYATTIVTKIYTTIYFTIQLE